MQKILAAYQLCDPYRQAGLREIKTRHDLFLSIFVASHFFTFSSIFIYYFHAK
ncbi:MAG: hypothetical protein ACHQF0_01695 [Chitinophagales bacterium]